jgi:hypothetical protein
MNKETFYFPHDYEPTSDPKIQALLGEYGGMGYGVFWRVVEMMHSNAEHKLPLKQYIFLAIAKQMLASAEQTEAIIHFAILPCELFISDGEYFWSNRVNENFKRRMEISEIRSKAGRIGAIAKQKLASAEQNLAKPGKGKEKKGKESRVKKSIFIPPTLEEVSGYCFERNNGINPQHFIDSNTAKGWVTGKLQTPIKDWKAVVRTWENNSHNRNTAEEYVPEFRDFKYITEEEECERLLKL